MEYILSTLINLMISGVASAMDTIGTSVLKILTMDIGGGSSMFEIVFGSDAMNTFYRMFTIMAMGILALNYLWQMIKIMYTAEGGTESPVSLTIRTILAGIFIYAAASIVIYAESWFGKFYSFLLNLDSMDRTGFFRNFLDSLQTTFSGSGAGIGDLLIVAVFIIALSVQFIHYLVEVVERYVVLGVLIYTAPLPVATSGSKSTSNIFASWVRMVVSQLFLMVCNVIFMRMFLVGFTNYNIAITVMQVKLGVSSSDTTTVTLIWGLILYGVLYVGQRVDSYLGTLGLSAAQTGRGMVAALSQTAQSIRRAANTAFDIGRGIQNIRANHHAENAQKAAEYKENNQPVRKDASNSVTADTMRAAADNKISKSDIEKTGGTSWANGFTSGAEGLSSEFNNSLDRAATGKLEEGGRFKMHGQSDGNGNAPEYTVTPMNSIKDKESLSNTEGRIVNSNGRDYLVQSTGATPSARAAGNELLFQDKAAETKLAAEGFSPMMQHSNIKGNDVSTNMLGAYDRITTDANGQSRYEQMLNTGLYAAPSESASSAVTNIGEYGDSQFHKISVPLAPQDAINDGSLSALGGVGGNYAVTRLPESSYAALATGDTATQLECLANSFRSFDTAGISNIQADAASGSFTFEKGGNQYVAFSGVEQSLSANGASLVSGVEHITADNGAVFAVAQIDASAYANYQMTAPSGQENRPIAEIITQNNPNVIHDGTPSADTSSVVFSNPKEFSLPDVTRDPFAGQQNDIASESFRKNARGYRQ